jgi:hypothetical protein
MSDDLEFVEQFVTWFAIQEHLNILLEQIEAINDDLDELKSSLDELNDDWKNGL